MTGSFTDLALQLRKELSIPDSIHNVNILYVLKKLNIKLILDNSQDHYDFEIDHNEYIILQPYYETKINCMEIMKQVAKISYMIMLKTDKKEIDKKYWLNRDYIFFAYQFLFPKDEFIRNTNYYYYIVDDIAEEYGIDNQTIIDYGKYLKVFKTT